MGGAGGGGGSPAASASSSASSTSASQFGNNILGEYGGSGSKDLPLYILAGVVFMLMLGGGAFLFLGRGR